MQRTVNSGREVDLEKQQMNTMEHHIEIPDHNDQQHKNPPMAAKARSRSRRAQSTTTAGLLPLFHNSRTIKPTAHRLSVALHLIPLLVILCFFFLWWFSSPANANLVVKDGRMTQVQLIERPFFFNDTDVVPDVGRLTILAVSTSPNPSVELTLRMTTDHETVDTHPTSGYNI